MARNRHEKTLTPLDQSNSKEDADVDDVSITGEAGVRDSNRDTQMNQRL